MLLLTDLMLVFFLCSISKKGLIMEPMRSSDSKNQSVLIIGAGAFGIGLAISALENSQRVSFLSSNFEKLE